MLNCKVELYRMIPVHGKTPERRVFHAENVSAEEAPQKKGARLQKENVYI